MVRPFCLHATSHENQQHCNLLVNGKLEFAHGEKGERQDYHVADEIGECGGLIQIDDIRGTTG